MDLHTFLQAPDSAGSCFSEPGIYEIQRVGRGRPGLLIELPHGATDRQHFTELRGRLRGDRFPDDLIAFFYVNTDIGTPECAREIARRFSDPDTGDVGSTLILRSLIPRTFIDCNRVVDAHADDFIAAGVTQAVPDYVRDERDQALLLSMHGSYQDAADRAYREVCGDGGLALALHSYAPRSVGIERVDDDIVTALRDAYRPENWSRWPQRPEADLLDRDLEGSLLSPEILVEDIVQGLQSIGVEAKRSCTYRLHPSTAGYRHAIAYPERVICLEFRRDLLADPFDPFAPMHISEKNVARLCRPVADALRSFSMTSSN